MGRSKAARQVKQMIRQGLVDEADIEEMLKGITPGNRKNLLASIRRSTRTHPGSNALQIQERIDALDKTFEPQQRADQSYDQALERMMMRQADADNVVQMPGRGHRQPQQQGSTVSGVTSNMPSIGRQSNPQTTAADAEAKKQAEDLQKALLEAAQKDVNFRVLQPFASCLVEPSQLDEAIASAYNDIYIHVNGNFYKHVKLSEGRFVRVKVKGLPSKFSDIEKSLKVQSVDEQLNFLPDGKIPFVMWQQIVEFFRQVMKIKKSDIEAQAFIMWEKERGYYISIPKQEVSKASVRFTHDAESLPPGAIIVVDVHSHNTMGAFFSGTDDNNDKNNICYSAVVGKINDKTYEWTMRFNLHDMKIKADLDDVFDIREEVSIPAEWLDRLERPSYQGSTAMGKWVGNGTSTGSTSTSGDYHGRQGKWTFPSSDARDREDGGNHRNYGNRKDPAAGFEDQQPMGFLDWCEAQGFTLDESGGLAPISVDSSNDSGVNSDQKNAQPMDPRKRAQLEELLSPISGMTDTETSSETPSTTHRTEDERLDGQVTAWLESHGYDANGNDILTNARSGQEDVDFPTQPSAETQTLMVSSSLAEGYDMDEDNGDPVGFAATSEHYDEVLAVNGKSAADNYELIDTLITELEGCDGALRDIMTQAYHLMTEKGQQLVQQNGL